MSRLGDSGRSTGRSPWLVERVALITKYAPAAAVAHVLNLNVNAVGIREHQLLGRRARIRAPSHARLNPVLREHFDHAIGIEAFHPDTKMVKSPAGRPAAAESKKLQIGRASCRER